jgi:hypothetical protein
MPANPKKLTAGAATKIAAAAVTIFAIAANGFLT